MATSLDKTLHKYKKYNCANNKNIVSDIQRTETDESFKYITPCPICGKRVFYVSEPPDKPTRIRLKCPHCRKIVRIPISAT